MFYMYPSGIEQSRAIVNNETVTSITFALYI